jgi:hypothetical protein
MTALRVHSSAKKACRDLSTEAAAASEIQNQVGKTCCGVVVRDRASPAWGTAASERVALPLRFTVGSHAPLAERYSALAALASAQAALVAGLFRSATSTTSTTVNPEPRLNTCSTGTTGPG